MSEQEKKDKQKKLEERARALKDNLKKRKIQQRQRENNAEKKKARTISEEDKPFPNI